MHGALAGRKPVFKFLYDRRWYVGDDDNELFADQLRNLHDKLAIWIETSLFSGLRTRL